jgi:hypothetical protein
MKEYFELLELTRRQRELIDAGRWPEAAQVGDEWQRLVDRLPSSAPAEARGILEEAGAIAWSNTAALEAKVAAVVRELEHLTAGRQAIGSYAGADAPGAFDARV